MVDADYEDFLLITCSLVDDPVAPLFMRGAPWKTGRLVNYDIGGDRAETARATCGIRRDAGPARDPALRRRRARRGAGLGVRAYWLAGRRDALAAHRPIPCGVGRRAALAHSNETGDGFQTTSANAWVGRGILHQSWLAWRAGVTATWATGYILQFDDQFRDVRFDNAAAGVGPSFALRLQTPGFARLVVGVEGSGGLIFDTRHFPAGGDIYNFMRRAGPSIERHVAERWWGASAIA